MSGTIPTAWCIDVEPDAAVPTAAERRWTGFEVMVDLVERSRPVLAARTGAPFVATWFLRMDPMIETVYGRADHVLVEHANRFETILAAGDRLALHVHPFRLDRACGEWYSDHSDLEWARVCVTSAVDAFTNALGRAPTAIRMGGYYLPDDLVDHFVDLGLRVDLTSEPGRRPVSNDGSHGAYSTAPSTDFRPFPRRRYRPSRRALAEPAAAPTDARAITLVPLTAYDTRSRLIPRHRAVARRVLRPGTRHEPLSPWRAWPSTAWFWDCAAAAAEQVGNDHLAFASRTLPPSDPGAANQDRVFEGLVEHPLATRLHFVDPLELALGPDHIGRA